jgi:hypothetical protein
MSSVFELYSAQTAQVATNVLLPPIVKYLAERKTAGPVTVEELVGVLRLPAPTTPAPMQFLGGGGAAAAAVATSSRTRKVQSVDGSGCKYIMTRGVNKDKPCGAAVKPGEIFCTACKKKKNNKGVSSSISSGSSGVGNIPNPFAPIASQPVEQPSLDCTPHTMSDGSSVLKAKVSNIPDHVILTQKADGSVCVHGRLTPDNKCTPLAEEHKAILRTMGLNDFQDQSFSKMVTAAAPGGPATGVSSVLLPSSLTQAIQTPQGTQAVAAPMIPVVPPIPGLTQAK